MNCYVTHICKRHSGSMEWVRCNWSGTSRLLLAVVTTYMFDPGRWESAAAVAVA